MYYNIIIHVLYNITYYYNMRHYIIINVVGVPRTMSQRCHGHGHQSNLRPSQPSSLIERLSYIIILYYAF